MDRIFILNYNNYYNRIRKRFDDLEDYMPFLMFQKDGKPGEFIVNFQTADDINTVQKITWNGNIPDYLLRCDAATNEIKSRWFVIEAFKIRGGQYVLTLYRDTIADYYNEVMNAPIFIEKGNLDIDNPLIFNDENMSLNEIKTDEILLKDKTGCAWLIGYYAKNATDLNGTVPINNITDIPAIEISTPIDSWKFFEYTNTPFYKKPSNVFWRFYGQNVDRADSGYFDIKHPNIYNWGGYAISRNSSSLNFNNLSPNLITGPNLAEAVGNRRTELYNEVKEYLPYATDEEFDEFISYQDAIIKDSDGKYFKVLITAGDVESRSVYVPDSGELFNLLSSVARYGSTGTPNASSFRLITHNKEYRLALKELVYLSTEYNLDGEKIITTDAPWNIFAIPYGNITVKDTAGNLIINTTADVGLKAAMGIQSQQASNVYDIQLLPYCPVKDLIYDDGEIRVENELQYSLITSPDPSDPETKKITTGIIFNVPESRFSLEIIHNVEKGQTAIEQKVNDKCDKWRLCSPNYASYFDFSIEKNGGLNNFNVDCEYKPFNPYIHVNPNFGGLYGKDFDDPRGLICGGDFSLNQIIDNWENYKIQNKNFQLTFDRQIQNMEIQNKYALIGDIVGAATGNIQGGAAGAAAGAYMGGGNAKGVVAGAGLGAIASAAGGAADITINEALRQETIDYTKDLFGYNLGNIKALPDTISKVSSFNNNNKIFPVLEYYTCHPVEKKAFLNKIAFNGMSIMTIGILNEIKNNTWSYEIDDETITSKNYVKGQLIRLEEIPEDFHVINDIANELNKGVYL